MIDRGPVLKRERPYIVIDLRIGTAPDAAAEALSLIPGDQSALDDQMGALHTEHAAAAPVVGRRGLVVCDGNCTGSPRDDLGIASGSHRHKAAALMDLRQVAGDDAAADVEFGTARGGLDPAAAGSGISRDLSARHL